MIIICHVQGKKLREDIMSVYGIQFTDGPVNSFANLVYIGKEIRVKNYDWNGLARKTNDQFIFQYTYAGAGKFSSHNSEHRVDRGCAFLARTGTNHRYYLPKDSKMWEFAFITLSGQEALACWAFAHEKVGDVIRFAPDSPVVRSLETIFGLAAAKEIRNGYTAAGLATQFLMELYQALKYKSVPSKKEPEVIEQARAMLTEHYRYIGSMKEVSAQLGMEPYQFSTGLSPGQFRRGEATIPKMDHIAFDFS
jgi:hypothetical protein